MGDELAKLSHDKHPINSAAQVSAASKLTVELFSRICAPPTF